MKVVKLTAADIDKLRKTLPPKPAPETFHHEELLIDSLSFGLARPIASADIRTNAYSVGFRSGDTQYVLVVRPTIHEIPSITLNVIKTSGGGADGAEFASYTVLSDTVTTLKGRVIGAPGQIVGTTGDTATASLDLGALIGYLQVE